MDMRVLLRVIGLSLASLVAAVLPSHATDYFSLDRRALLAPKPLGPPTRFVPPLAPVPLDESRLRAYGETETSPAQPAGIAGATAEQMIALRKRLDRAFHDAGLTYELSVDDKQILHGAQPSLVVSGKISPKAIYRINNATNILEIVRKVGFRSLVFYDTEGEHGAFVFDLGEAQPCARTVCF